jgi:hypothetical protein
VSTLDQPIFEQDRGDLWNVCFVFERVFIHTYQQQVIGQRVNVVIVSGDEIFGGHILTAWFDFYVIQKCFLFCWGRCEHKHRDENDNDSKRDT